MRYLPRYAIPLFFSGDSATTFSVTTTGASETLTINSFGVSAETTISWGDGQSDAYTGTALRTHVYASAGTYTISIDQPENVTTFDLRDSKCGLNSADIKNMVNIGTFIAIGLASGTFNSSDIASWSPSIFQFNGMSAGYSGTFNSSDIVSWSPSTFHLIGMPAGYSGTFNSSDVALWSPVVFRISGMPTGYSFVFGDTDFNGWTAATSIKFPDNGLTQAEVDTILFSSHGIGASRTASNGTIDVSGSNAAPSGTFQAAAVCPVDTDTPGKEVAHELQNDTCAVGFNTWATVTFTA